MDCDSERALGVDHDQMSNYDLDVPPVSGNEYLQRVQQEAKTYPDVVIADLDVQQMNKKQTVKVLAGSGLQPAPSGYTPSNSWQKHQISSFSAIRQKFVKHRTHRRKTTAKKTKPVLPKKEDTEGWCQFCFGRLRPTGHTDMDVSTDSEVPESSHPSAVSPLLSFVVFMDQPTVIQVLEYHINWFEATGFTEKQGQWLYALLVCLEKPLDPESCSLLRTLARNCANLRATLESPSHEFLSPLNLFITLVSRYFDQGDLADL